MSVFQLRKILNKAVADGRGHEKVFWEGPNAIKEPYVYLDTYNLYIREQPQPPEWMK